MIDFAGEEAWGATDALTGLQIATEFELCFVVEIMELRERNAAGGGGLIAVHARCEGYLFTAPIRVVSDGRQVTGSAAYPLADTQSGAETILGVIGYELLRGDAASLCKLVAALTGLNLEDFALGSRD